MYLGYAFLYSSNKICWLCYKSQISFTDMCNLQIIYIYIDNEIKLQKKDKKPIADKKRLQFSVCASSFMLTTHVRLQASNFEMISNIGLSRHFKSSFKLILYIRNIYFWQRLSFISIWFLFLCCDVIVLKLL